MDRKRFKGISDEFSPKFNNFKELTEELRRTLFPIKNESFFTGTYRDPEKLYKFIIDAFNRTMTRYTESELNVKE